MANFGDKLNNLGEKVKNIDTAGISGKINSGAGAIGSNFDFKANADADEVKTITGKFLGGANTRIGTKIVKFARFFEIGSIILLAIGVIDIVVSIVVAVFSAMFGEYWATGIAFICMAGGLVVFLMGLFSIATTWALYGFGQVVNDVQSIRKNTEGGFGGAVEKNPDNLPEL